MRAEAPARVRRSADFSPATVIGRRLAGRAARSGIAWGLAFGLYELYAVFTYAAEYPTVASRLQIAQSLGANTGLLALLGQAPQLGTMAGFTAWRSLGLLAVLGAMWGLLTSTKWLRGEEEAGRWELYLAGQATRRGAAAQALVGLTAGWVSLLGATAVITVLAGLRVDPPPSIADSLFFSLALTSSAAVFVAVGALASQLAATRRQALTIGAAVLGAAFLIRMAADSNPHLAWARWASPLGWVEELRPLTGPQPVVLVPILVLIVVLNALTVFLASARDLGSSTLPGTDAASARTWLLAGPTSLAIRLVRPVAIGWIAAIAVVGSVGGLIAKSVASGGSSAVGAAFSRLGAERAGIDAFLGIIFLLIATLMLLVAAGLVAANREEEAEGRLDNLLVRPVGRLNWLTGRLAVGAALIVLCGAAGGLLTWAGAASQGGDVGWTSLFEAGLNAAPPALFLLGLGTLFHATVPRLASTACYAVVAWSFVIQVIGSMADANRWLLDTSVLHYMALAPAASPDWPSAALMVGLGFAAAIAGGIIFTRRDLVNA